jgi:hypothetical protein
MALPTRNIPDLRAARKIAVHLSSMHPGQLVDVTQQDDGDYRITYARAPSRRSVGAFVDGRPHSLPLMNPLSEETKEIIVGVAGGILVAGLVGWLISKL